MFLGDAYHEMIKDHGKTAKLRFPHKLYGVKKDSNIAKKSFPQSFKRHFFTLLKSFVHLDSGIKRIKNAPPAFFLPTTGGNCTVHTGGCPEDCNYKTNNKKVLLRSKLRRMAEKIRPAYRSRIWRRADKRKLRSQILMTNSEIENCTFEPSAGGLSKYEGIKGALSQETTDHQIYVDSMGLNFQKRHPEVFKLGVLKKAKLKLREGKYG
jgi:hypothetical protein